MKVVISDSKTGKSYQTEVDEAKSKALHGAKIGEEIEGSLIGLSGYKLKVTGGSDKDGFPMRADVHGMERKRILISNGPGIRKKGKGERIKKTVRGNIVSDQIAQINVVITKQGSKPIPEILGIVEKKEESKEAEKEVKEEPKEEKPKEEVKEEPKVEPKAEEEPVEEKKEEAEEPKEEKKDEGSETS